MGKAGMIRNFYKQHSDINEKENNETMLTTIATVLTATGIVGGVLTGLTVAGKSIIAGIQEVRARQSKKEADEEEA